MDIFMRDCYIFLPLLLNFIWLLVKLALHLADGKKTPTIKVPPSKVPNMQMCMCCINVSFFPPS